MTHSSLTDRVQLTTDSSPRLRSIDRFIVHHAATTSLDAILSLFQPGGREVSANYALGTDGTLVNAVDEDRRAWTSSSAYWDGRAVTIEVANSYAGDPWPVSDASFDKLARLIADVATRYKFPINDDTVLTHRELYTRYGDSYPTACPGDLQRRKGELIALAIKYQSAAPAGGDTTEIPELPKENSMAQRQYFARIRPDGTDDGEWMLAGVDLFNDPANDPAVTKYYTRDGYWVTNDKATALKWARQYSFAPTETKAVQLQRTPYIAQQGFAAEDHQRWVKGIRSLFAA